MNVLSSLEAHWHVLEAEVVEINRDIDYCEQCLRKYGEWFNSPLQYLRARALSHFFFAAPERRPRARPNRAPDPRLHDCAPQELKRTKKNKMCAAAESEPHNG